MGMAGSNLIGLEVLTYILPSLANPPVFTDITPVGIIRDETVNIETALADVTDRRAAGWRLQRPTLKEGSIDLQLTYDTNDTNFEAFQEAFFDSTKLIMAFMDSDATVAGAQGLVSAVRVTSFSSPRSLEDAVVVDVTLTLDLDDSSPPLAPTWVTTA